LGTVCVNSEMDTVHFVAYREMKVYMCRVVCAKFTARISNIEHRMEISPVPPRICGKTALETCGQICLVKLMKIICNYKHLNASIPRREVNVGTNLLIFKKKRELFFSFFFHKTRNLFVS
jgi:hypothetical protein